MLKLAKNWQQGQKSENLEQMCKMYSRPELEQQIFLHILNQYMVANSVHSVEYEMKNLIYILMCIYML